MLSSGRRNCEHPGVPVSMLFLLPFVFASKLGLSFWQSYGIACGILMLGFGLHRWLNYLL